MRFVKNKPKECLYGIFGFLKDIPIMLSFSIRVEKQLFSGQSDFQRIDVFLILWSLADFLLQTVM